ncbi:ATP-binding protein [Streptomyces afghaniensis]|uniref:ATP-binding protein n=1 Tax=Streptomyces afghaniensis TaxID=66865 RepID=UPI00278505BC|nr:ATP-binding protein [Streptomyces afghaniensis]MDQ1019001.1 anti-sigma regulatory factor (Ser/Thr protein kinase) [Streptomyces afghaniensis]
MPVVTKTFLRTTESVPAARRFVHATLLDWKLPDLADPAELVTFELASNAILHASHASFRVTLRRLSDDQVQVAVIDRSSTLPRQADPGDDDHGRGLAIFDALSLEWGAEPTWWGTLKGKKVWADLAAPEPAEPPDRYVPIHPSRQAQVIYVLIVVAVAALIVAGVATSQ